MLAPRCITQEGNEDAEEKFGEQVSRLHFFFCLSSPDDQAGSEGHLPTRVLSMVDQEAGTLDKVSRDEVWVSGVSWSGLTPPWYLVPGIDSGRDLDSDRFDYCTSGISVAE